MHLPCPTQTDRDRALGLHVLHHHRALATDCSSQRIGQHRVEAFIHAVTRHTQTQLRHSGFPRLLERASGFGSHCQAAVKVVCL